ncbi:amidohydrolase [Brevibacillus humidisoli]|uniref:M20 metallopeptidase family protein n=1 Tax=Brevibacillus humidisoli TaxID=2895522 RepID=UPI001E5A7039|nr:amidohydrolase [Brevibacillus humidisoli]UFJ39357.1 amidohydrolase [Brevibacillus humidisoli]
MTIKEACQSLTGEIVKWRREFHRHPELSYAESRTASVVAGMLRQFGLDVREGVNGYGVVADLVGKIPGKTVALRADMDALAIVEETGLPYASEVPGIMHACGHDGHMAALLGAAQILSGMRDRLRGSVRFIFQPAEEIPPGGAIGMIEAGALDGVDVIFGLHLWSEFPVGTFYTTQGPMMAAADLFTVTISGKGGHGGLPHKTVDSLVIASHLVMASQHIVSRQVNPLDSGVVTFGLLQSGSAFNVIADKAVLKGTVRSFDPVVRDLLQGRLEQTAASIAQMYGARIDMDYVRGYPAVINHEREARAAMQEAEPVFGAQHVGIMQPNMAGEDFAYYLQKVPGAFCFVGAGLPEGPVYPHHHPRFVIDERALPLATEWLCRMALRYVM